MENLTTDLPADGRRARGERTRLKVLDALLALVGEGNLHPTAQEVASRANVALRTVYHHFEDVEALRRTAFDLQLERHRQLLSDVDTTLDLENRVNLVVRQLRRLFEGITPIRRATLFDEHASTEMAEGLRRGRQLRRQQLEQAFAPELGAEREDRRLLLDALDTATSWQSWYYLRISLGRSANAAEASFARLLRALLGSGAPHRMNGASAKGARAGR